MNAKILQRNLGIWRWFPPPSEPCSENVLPQSLIPYKFQDFAVINERKS